MQEINKDEVEDVGGGLQFPGSGIPGMPTPLPGPGWPNPCPVPNPFAETKRAGNSKIGSEAD